MRRQQRLGVCRYELQHSLDQRHARPRDAVRPLHAHHRYAAIAGSLAKKGKVAESAGTLSTTNGMFVFLLVFIVLLIGALSFFPALALGPVAEFFQMIA